MIQTFRCRRCGSVLEACVEFVPGLPLAQSHQAVASRLERAKIQHADRCPARGQNSGSSPPRSTPRPSLISRLSPAFRWRRRAPG